MNKVAEKKKDPFVSCAHLVPGMTVKVKKSIYRIESSVKVTAAKGASFIKTKLRELISDKLVEMNFKPDQKVEEVSLKEKKIVFLYMEGKDYLFLDIDDLDQCLLGQNIIGDKSLFLKEGIELKASFYGDTVFSVELPQFLELAVTEAEESKPSIAASNSTKTVGLETGAKVDVPLFIEVGDIIKVDTLSKEFVQRV